MKTNSLWCASKSLGLGVWVPKYHIEVDFIKPVFTTEGIGM